MKMHKFHDLSGEKALQLLIITDKNGNQIGTGTRRICHQGAGRPHLAFMAFIADSAGNLILARRSKNKSLWSLFWDASVVSHVLPGESVVEAANRRGKQELGVDVKFRQLAAFYYFEKYNGNCENEYCHVLIGKSGKKVEFNPVEIESIRKISPDNLKKEIHASPEIFTPWLKLALAKIKIPNL